MSTKLHFRDYNPKQMILFPQRLDKDIAENDPVRVVDGVINNLRLDNFKKLYKERGRSPYHPKMMLKAVIYGYMNFDIFRRRTWMTARVTGPAKLLFFSLI